jgi:uncharacterized protein with PIN domain
VNYHEYIKSELWAQQSLERRAEAGKCLLCGREIKQLHLHHNTYRRLGNERYHDTVVLCMICHKFFHDNFHYEGVRHHFVRKL